MSDKPMSESEPIERWTAQRKAAIIFEFFKSQISVPEAARKYGFTQGDNHKKADKNYSAGVEELKINLKDQEAKHQTYIKRLRAKIGQPGIDDEIRQKATRPFCSGDQTSSV